MTGNILFYIPLGFILSFWQYERWFLLLRKVVTMSINLSNHELAALLLIQTNRMSVFQMFQMFQMFQKAFS